MRAAIDNARRGGFTLVELLLSLALVSIVFLGLVRLLDTSLTIWERTETGRELNAVSSGVLDLLEEDLRALEGGPRGDLLFEWRLVDVDRDGQASAPLPLLRFVRQASAADLLALDPEAAVDPEAIDLLEVCWMMQPSNSDEDARRSVSVLWRGVRRLGDETTLSFFSEDFLDERGRPVPGALDVVSSGVLWMRARFAAQTSVVHSGWEDGGDLRDVARSWDAWSRGRPDRALTDWNQPHPGSPRADEQPVLPRRIRLELELERPSETQRRPSLEAFVDKDEGTLRVDDERRLPPVGGFVLLDEEWLEVTAVNGANLGVRRGARGTRAAAHAAGARLHFGRQALRDLPVALYREDWNL